LKNPSLNERLTNIPSTERVYKNRYANLILKYYEYKSNLPDNMSDIFFISITDIEVRINVDTVLTDNFKKDFCI